MSQSPSTLYAKLLGETAPITWQELQPFFARGALLWINESLDMIEVAEAVAQNQASRVSAWLTEGLIATLDEQRAVDWLARDPLLWAVVVAPWVLVQERAERPVVH